MNIDFNEVLPKDFSPISKVWIYQASRKLSLQHVLFADSLLQDFVENWKSHGAPVKGFATILFGQFILLMADESSSSVGGCSTDSSVRIIKQIEQETGISMFDRQLLAFHINDTVQLLPMAQFVPAIISGKINGDTIYFNNTVLTKTTLITDWMIPISNSWLASKMKKNATNIE